MARKKEQVLIKTPPAPEYLGEIAKQHWSDTFGSLVAMKLATELDRPVIEMACTQYEQYRTAVTDKDRQAAITSYLRIMSKYGATPKDRKMMKYTPQPQRKGQIDKDIAEDFDL
ncbi:MAG: hypothetical protein EOM01_11180 [Spirochaetia bacterium]|nr:hypothetical protein [Spirochaetia bacterium]